MRWREKKRRRYRTIVRCSIFVTIRKPVDWFPFVWLSFFNHIYFEQIKCMFPSSLSLPLSPFLAWVECFIYSSPLHCVGLFLSLLRLLPIVYAFLHSIYSIATRLMYDIQSVIMSNFRNKTETHSHCQSIAVLHRQGLWHAEQCMKNCLFSTIFDTANGKSNVKTIEPTYFCTILIDISVSVSDFFPSSSSGYGHTHTITMQIWSVFRMHIQHILSYFGKMEWKAKLVFEFEFGRCGIRVIMLQAVVCSWLFVPVIE